MICKGIIMSKSEVHHMDIFFQVSKLFLFLKKLAIMMVYFIILENRCEGPISHNIAENVKLRDLFWYKKCYVIIYNEILHAHN